MSDPHKFLKQHVLTVLVLCFHFLVLHSAYSQSEGKLAAPGEPDQERVVRKERISARDLIQGEKMIRRAGAREALDFFEELTRVPVDDERKGFVYFRMAKIYYAFGDYQNAYESIEVAVPLMIGRYNLFSAMHLRMKIFAEMGWFREAKQVASFLVDSGFVGAEEMEMYLFMANADVRLENPVSAAVEYERAFVIGDYGSRVEVFGQAEDQLSQLFDRITNPVVFRNVFESTKTLHFRTLVSYLAAKRSLDERQYGFARYFLEKYFDIADFTGEEERGIEIEVRLSEEKKGKPVVAVYLPFSGPHSDYSFMVLSGLEMGLRRNLPTGSMSDSSFFIEVFDTYGDSSMLGRHLDGGKINRNVLALLGPLTGKEGYFIDPRYDSPLLFYLGQKYLARGYGLINFGLKPSQEALKLVNFAFASGVFKIALLYPENGYGNAYRKEVLRAARMNGIRIVIDKGYPPETEDFQWLIKDIVQTENFDEYAGMEERDVSMPVDFDGVFILDVPERGVFLHSQMVYYNVKVPYFVFSSWVKESDATAEKSDLKNIHVVTDFNPYSSSGEVKEFIARFKDFYGESPDRFAGYGYDLGSLFDSYLRRVSILGQDFSDIREGLKRELYGEGRYHGVTGIVEFYPVDQAVRNLTLLRVNHGSVKEVFVPVY